MLKIPFLRPSLPPVSTYTQFLESIDESGIYSNFGPLSKQFESRLIGDFCDGGFGTTVSNATLGLMLAINASKRTTGQLALMPSFTFAATAQAVKWCGLEPYYIDIDAKSWAVDPQLLTKAVNELGDQVAIVLPYATFGNALNLSPYQSLIADGVPVVVDAAPGFGTKNPDGTAYGKSFNGAIVYSFHATKPFGIGEGGFVYSANESLIEKVRLLSNFGFEKPGITCDLGLNAKMSEYAAAVGLAVLEGFPEKKKALQNIYQTYQKALDNASLFSRGCALQQAQGSRTHQFLPLLLPTGTDKHELMKLLTNAGIETRSYFDPPCHSQHPLNTTASTDLTMTDDIAKRILCLPLWHGMNNETVEHIVSQLSLALP